MTTTLSHTKRKQWIFILSNAVYSDKNVCYVLEKFSPKKIHLFLIGIKGKPILDWKIHFYRKLHYLICPDKIDIIKLHN